MYVLGIDVGTTFTAAAVRRDGTITICRLGARSAAIPSVVLLREDGTLLVGEAANRRAVSEPERVAREFKRRFGDSTPLLLGGTPLSPEALTAHLLRAVVDDVTAREGAEPAAVCVSHPANWGPFKTDLLCRTVRLAGLDMPVRFVTEPEAAAVNYAAEQRVAVGETIAVYDLGGGTFDAAVLRRTAKGFSILGQPEGVDRLGGMDIDAAVFDHLVRTLGEQVVDLDEGDPNAIAAMARLRQECTEAKETLSSDTDTSLPVLLPGVATTVRLTRSELEAMVRPALHASIAATRRALRSASVTPDDLAAVLLVGGSSRMPLVAQLVGGELGRPVAVDAEPKHAVALGAARLAGEHEASREQIATHAPGAGGSVPEPVPEPVSEPGPPSVPESDSPQVPTRLLTSSRVRRSTAWAAAAVAVVAVTAVSGVYASRSGAVRAVAAQETPTPSTASGPAATASSTGATGGPVMAPAGSGAVRATTPPTSAARSAEPGRAAAGTATTTTSRKSGTPSTASAAQTPEAQTPEAVGHVTASRNRASGSTRTSIVVSWPASAGATSYLVEWRPAGTVGAGGSRSYASGPATISGLQPGTPYDVRVVPVNARGRGSATRATGSTAR